LDGCARRWLSAAHVRHSPKVNRKDLLQQIPLKARNLVERFFNKIKNFRRVATHQDKLAENFSRPSNWLSSASGDEVMSPRPSLGAGTHNYQRSFGHIVAD
jgi:transposase